MGAQELVCQIFAALAVFPNVSCMSLTLPEVCSEDMELKPTKNGKRHKVRCCFSLGSFNSGHWGSATFQVETTGSCGDNNPSHLHSF